MTSNFSFATTTTTKWIEFLVNCLLRAWDLETEDKIQLDFYYFSDLFSTPVLFYSIKRKSENFSLRKPWSTFFGRWNKEQYRPNCKSTCESRPVWPDVGVKSSPKVSKSYPRSSRIIFYKRVRFFKIAQKVANNLGYFW